MMGRTFLCFGSIRNDDVATRSEQQFTHEDRNKGVGTTDELVTLSSSGIPCLAVSVQLNSVYGRLLDSRQRCAGGSYDGLGI